MTGYKHQPFPKIQRLKGVMRELYHREMFGTHLFEGRVKLHGTNAALALDDEENLVCQSRNRVLTPDKDNCGFASSFIEKWEGLSPREKEVWRTWIYVVGGGIIYGEWVGPGVQSGVALSQLPGKVFVAFSTLPVLYTCEVRVEPNIGPFAHLAEAEAQVYKPTLEVEQRCLFAWENYGIEGIGEGLVWTCPDLGMEFAFKTKGDKHTKSKVKKVKEPREPLTEEQQYLYADAVSVARLERGLEWLREQNLEESLSNIGQVLGWFKQDVAEELVHELSELQDRKQFMKRVTTGAAMWYRLHFGERA